MPRAGRQSPIEPLPGLAAIARAKHRGFAFHAGAWPHRSAVHRHDPQGLVIPRVTGHGEADVADFFRHVVPDPLPPLFFDIVLPVEPVDAAMILVIPTTRVGRMDYGVMWIVTV